VCAALEEHSRSVPLEASSIRSGNVSSECDAYHADPSTFLAHRKTCISSSWTALNDSNQLNATPRFPMAAPSFSVKHRAHSIPPWLGAQQNRQHAMVVVFSGRHWNMIFVIRLTAWDREDMPFPNECGSSRAERDLFLCLSDGCHGRDHSVSHARNLTCHAHCHPAAVDSAHPSVIPTCADPSRMNERHEQAWPAKGCTVISLKENSNGTHKKQALRRRRP